MYCWRDELLTSQLCLSALQSSHSTDRYSFWKSPCLILPHVVSISQPSIWRDDCRKISKNVRLWTALIHDQNYKGPFKEVNKGQNVVFMKILVRVYQKIHRAGSQCYFLLVVNFTFLQLDLILCAILYNFLTLFFIIIEGQQKKSSFCPHCSFNNKAC